MNEQQYEQFNTEAVQRNTACLDDLADKSPRTLLFGYDLSRATFHVYIDPTDGLIHVLKYIPVGTVNEEKFLVLSHTSGPDGGVARNDQFVPDKRLYPESCDLEFCRLLRRYDVSLPFTTFDAAGETRVDRFNGFAGYVAAPNAVHGVNLAVYLGAPPNTFGDAGLLCQLMREACVELDVPHAVRGETVWAAKPDVIKVVAQVQAYLSTMSPAASLHPEDLADTILRDTIVSQSSAVSLNHYPDRFGAATFTLNYVFTVRLADDVEGAVRYVGADGVSALQGTYEGRPYLLVLQQPDKGQLHVNLFGCPDTFIQKMVLRHGLKQVEHV